MLLQVCGDVSGDGMLQYSEMKRVESDDWVARNDWKEDSSRRLAADGHEGLWHYTNFTETEVGGSAGRVGANPSSCGARNNWHCMGRSRPFLLWTLLNLQGRLATDGEIETTPHRAATAGQIADTFGLIVRLICFISKTYVSVGRSQSILEDTSYRGSILAEPYHF